jgi:hypothetical protein
MNTHNPPRKRHTEARMLADRRYAQRKIANKKRELQLTRIRTTQLKKLLTS